MTTESMRARFEAFILYWTGQDINYHTRVGTVGLMFSWEAWQAATLAERDRCAAVCDLQWTLTSGHVAKQCAEAIRKGD